MLESSVAWIVDKLWSTSMLYLVLFVGLLYTVRLVFPQVRLVRQMTRQLLGGSGSAQGVSSFQAFAMALGGRIGVGNIAGVATAIHFGGPGAIFWMWITAIVGSALAVVESSLAQVYKEEVNGEYRGGPAYYIRNGLRWKWFSKPYAIAYALAGVLAYAVTGPSIQAFNIADSASNAFAIDTRITGVFVAVLFSLVVFGGLKRIGWVCGIVVPFMAAAYIILGLIILALNASYVPAMFGLIFRSAFAGDALFGGMIGAAIMWGIRRAIYSSEAGMGSGAQASAAAEVSHPVKQGLAQGFSVYVDTLFVCTMTGLMILSTNSYSVAGPDGNLVVDYAPGLKAGPAYAQAAIDSAFPGFGSGFVAVAMFFFAFTTLLAFSFYADTNVSYLLRTSRWRGPVNVIVQVVLVVSIVLGAYRSSDLAWGIADIGVGLSTWMNLIALVLLAPVAVRVFRDYERQRKAGLDPVFDPDEAGIDDAPLWRKIAASYRAGSQEQPALARRS